MNQALPDSATAQEASGRVRCLGNLSLNLDNYRVSIEGEQVELTFREFELLRILAEQPDKILAYDTLTSAVWGLSGRRAIRHLNVVVHGLRAKLAASRPYVIETVRGRGYGLLRATAPAGPAASASSGGRPRDKDPPAPAKQRRRPRLIRKEGTHGI
jgi:DNA-binding response OmpR family regulator